MQELTSAIGATTLARTRPNVDISGRSASSWTFSADSTSGALSCRDGLAKPPPMTKKRLEAIVEANASPNTAGASSKASEVLQEHSVAKVKLKPTGSSKPQPRVDRSLKHLETLHQQTGVKENLHLGERNRIKLNTDLQHDSKWVRKPVLDFDVEFARLGNEVTRPKLDDSSMLSESDDELPDARGILGSLRKSDSLRPTTVSDSTDYGDPEFDALIADLPLTAESPMTGPHLSGAHALNQDTETTTLGRKRNSHFSESTRPSKRPNLTEEEFPMEVRVIQVDTVDCGLTRSLRRSTPLISSKIVRRRCPCSTPLCPTKELAEPTSLNSSCQPSTHRPQHLLLLLHLTTMRASSLTLAFSISFRLHQIWL